MQQRRVRLGDIVDDYCPRERRITNHAVVAMVEDEIRQTRCTTCDAEHVYKAAKLPARRRKGNAPAELYEEVLAGRPAPAVAESQTPEEAAATPAIRADADSAPAEPEAGELPAADAAGAEVPPEDGPVRRLLIRATLPRPEGQPASRPAPEFTIRQALGRNGSPRDAEHRGSHRGGWSGNGERTTGGGRGVGRPKRHRQAHPSRGGRGKKRSR